MTPTVLLLLSIFTLRARGCNDLDKEEVRILKDIIDEKNREGFPQVFPKDYVVPRYFSLDCDHQSNKCCVFTKAVLLSYSWTQLLKQLESVHLQKNFIAQLKVKLDDISEMRFQDTPDPSAFPSENASPGTLLSFTSSLLDEWLELNCPTEEKACVFPTPVTTEKVEKETEKKRNCHEGTAKEEKGNVVTDEEVPYGKEGEREKRWITVIPRNRDTRWSSSPGLFLFFCVLLLL